MNRFILSIAVFLLFTACGILAPTYTGDRRVYQTSFESEGDFSKFYVEPGPSFASAQAITSEKAMDGSNAHKAWITAARAPNNDATWGPGYTPHRAYPTIQFQKTSGGIYRTPCLVTLWVWLDISLAKRAPGVDDWFSFATLTPDAGDGWSRTVVVNLTPDGYIRLVHVPRQGMQEYLFQAGSANDPSQSLKYPLRSWVRLDICIDFSAEGGFARLWQNGTLISSAKVEGGLGGLAQAHFGLYAAAALSSGAIFNDNLVIREVKDEAEARDWLAR